MAGIRLENLTKHWPGGGVAAEEISLTIGEGELAVLVGPSGCGKSTTLRMIAGLTSPTSGRILIGGEDVTDLPPRRRDVAMVFQSYALYPHLTVAGNLAFGLRMRGVPRREREARVRETAELLGLTDLLAARPARLSGGQRQRVALGRAIVRKPRAFLLDEPLSNLDATLRVRMRAEIARLHRELGVTMVYVTHDQEEAMTLADRVAVMDRGRIQQVDPPLTVYRRPANRFVAGFIGSPAMNEIPARVMRGEAGTGLVLGVRPQDLRVTDGDGDLPAVVDVVEPLGSEVLVHLEAEVDGRRRELRLLDRTGRSFKEGERLQVELPRDRLHLFDEATGERIP
jgi:ABC-type sugar transport system ATPase subunit